MSLEIILTDYEQIGGRWVSSPELIAQKLQSIRAFVFDWDGVFNAGDKGAQHPSTYSEPDSVATNLLRHSHWLKYHNQAICAIITGADNPTAIHLAKREHFSALYQKCLHKTEALDHFCQAHNLRDEEICFFYDDVLDLSVAKRVGLRICLARPNTPFFNNYVIQTEAADYLTAAPGGQYGLREACEMLIQLQGNAHQTIESRVKFEGNYAHYLNERNAVPLCSYARTENGIEAVDML